MQIGRQPPIKEKMQIYCFSFPEKWHGQLHLQFHSLSASSVIIPSTGRHADGHTDGMKRMDSVPSLRPPPQSSIELSNRFMHRDKSSSKPLHTYAEPGNQSSSVFFCTRTKDAAPAHLIALSLATEIFADTPCLNEDQTFISLWQY